jgi:hypothetical protein
MRRRILVSALCAIVTACGSATAPSSDPASNGYAGQWSGTTAAGRPFSFTVSADQNVTDVAVGYGFNGCSGVKTFSGLRLAIAAPLNPTSPGPGFGYGSPTLDGTNYTQLTGRFPSDRTATGTAVFIEFPGCGSSVDIWNATRR